MAAQALLMLSQMSGNHVFWGGQAYRYGSPGAIGLQRGSLASINLHPSRDMEPDRSLTYSLPPRCAG